MSAEALTPSTRLTGNSPGDTVRAVLRLTKDQVEQTLCASLESRLDDAGIARRDRAVWIDSACGTAVAEMYERWLEAHPGELTGEQIDALPVGSVIYDRDGDRITRLEPGWIYPEDLSHEAHENYFTDRPRVYAPFTLTPKEPENA